ncbi:WXG100 family type VII secretion target [Pseudonocardia sp. ICBG601]|uniref:WXG100 family type VII secretion target n=1 Tax=Pseudonocardia sp. ICBG601 TaxID=2846759 RepID=UPI001CF67B3F|nr:WXG100 family type VII secretion target [Pseudonocardia sp. ICBG601]
MPLPRCYNYEAFDIATKAAWIIGKPGAEAMRQTSDGLRKLVDDMATTKQTLDRGMADLGISWQGPAARAAQESLDRTATGVDGTATVARNGADRMLDHGSAFERMRNQVRFMDPAEFSWIQRAGDNISEAWQSLRGRGADHVTIAEHNQINDEVANRALQKYESETSAIDDRFTTEAAAAPPPATSPGATPGPGGSPGPQPGISVAPGGGGVSGPTPGPAGVGLPPVGSASQPGSAPAGPSGGGGAGGGPGGGVGGGAGGGGGPSPVVPLPSGPASSSGAGGGGTGAPGSRVPPAPDRTRTPTRSPAPTSDAARTREDLARRFGDQVRRQQLVRPLTETRPGSGTGSFGVGAGSGAGRGGVGSPFGESRGTTRLPGAGTEPHGPGGRGGAGTAWGTEPRTPGPRSGGAAEPWTGAKGAEARGGAGYGPMAGGVPGGRGEGRDHRNRYVVPTDEVFDVGITATDAVLAPEDPGR